MDEPIGFRHPPGDALAHRNPDFPVLQPFGHLGPELTAEVIDDEQRGAFGLHHPAGHQHHLADEALDAGLAVDDLRQVEEFCQTLEGFSADPLAQRQLLKTKVGPAQSLGDQVEEISRRHRVERKYRIQVVVGDFEQLALRHGANRGRPSAAGKVAHFADAFARPDFGQGDLLAEFGHAKHLRPAENNDVEEGFGAVLGDDLIAGGNRYLRDPAPNRCKVCCAHSGKERGVGKPVAALGKDGGFQVLLRNGALLHQQFAQAATPVFCGQPALLVQGPANKREVASQVFADAPVFSGCGFCRHRAAR